jgi:hypothetical protein
MKWAGIFRSSGAGRAMLLIAACLVVLPPFPRSAHAQDDAEQVRELRRRQIEGLSEVERSRLERNFAEFKKMSEADREKLRQLDRELKQDDRDGGKLRQVMDEYCNWLGTISVSDREELRKTTDPKERVRLVREIRQKQESSTRPEFYGPGRGGNPRWSGLSRKDLDAVMKVLEQQLRDHVLSVHELQELEKRQDLARYAFLLELVVKNELPAIRDAIENKKPFQSRFPAAAIDAMAAAVTNEDQRKLLESQKTSDQLRHLVRMIWVGLGTEYSRNKPTEKQLEEYFVTLKGAQQDELMQLPSEHMQRRLSWMYIQEHPEKYPPLPREVWGLFPREGFENDPRRKPFGGPPGEPGERRGPGSGGCRGEKGGPPRRDKDGEKRPPAA